MKKELAALTAGLSIFAATAVHAEDAKKQESVKPAAAPAAEAAKPAEAVKVDEKAKWDFLPEVIATVGDKKVTREQFVKDIEEMMAQSPMGMKGGANPEAIKPELPRIVNGMVTFMVLLDTAEKAGYKPSPELVAKEFDKMLAKVPKDQLAMIEAQLKGQGMTMEDQKKKIMSDKRAQEGIAIQNWVEDTIAPKIKIDEKEAKEFYDKNQAMFTEPAEVKASHILIKPVDDKPESKEAAKKKAEEILAKLTKDPSLFEALAEAESSCPSGKQAKGDLGFFSKGRMVPEFEAAAFDLEPGKLSGIVETNFGYHIIKVTEKKAEKVLPFEEVKKSIEEQLKGKKVTSEIDAIVAKQKEALKVKINL